MQSSPLQHGSSPVATRGRRMSSRAAFWGVGFAFFATTAFSTAPSSLYGIYQQREHLSSLTLTCAYAVYAVGILVGLILIGHLSDSYGRRPIMVPSLFVALLAAVLLLSSPSLPALLAARVLTGLALGGVVATATAFIADLDSSGRGAPTRRASVVGTIANIGGLGSGPLIAGALAVSASDSLVLPFAVFAAALLLAIATVAAAPEGHVAPDPRPKYHPQRLKIPAQARKQFLAAGVGVFFCFAVFGLFAGLAGRFLAELGHPSPALTGLTIFLAFGAGVAVQTTTLHWEPRRLIRAGIAPMLIGLAMLVISNWLSSPSLVLFLLSGIVAGAGGGAIFRGSLTVVVAISAEDDRAGALAAFFTSGYIGVSLPVLGLGFVLETLSTRTALLIFAAVVGAGIVASAPFLVRQR